MSVFEEVINSIDMMIEGLESEKVNLEMADVVVKAAENYAERCRLQIEYNEARKRGEVEKVDFFEGEEDSDLPSEKQLEDLKLKLNQLIATLFFQQEGMSPKMVVHKRKLSKKKVESDKIHQIFDVYCVPYDMAKWCYLEELTDKNLPQQVSKDVAKRLALSVEQVVVKPFDEDECVFIELKIRGSEQDIEKVNEVLRARYDSDEQEDEETTER